MIWPLSPVFPPQIVLKFHSAPAFFFELFLQILLAFLLWTGLTRLRHAVNERTAIRLQSGQVDFTVPATSNIPRQSSGRNDVDKNLNRLVATALEGSQPKLTVSTSNSKSSFALNNPKQDWNKHATRNMQPALYGPLPGITVTPPIRITPSTPPKSLPCHGPLDEDSTDWEDAEELQEVSSPALCIEPAEEYAEMSLTPSSSFRPISGLAPPSTDVTALTAMPPSKGVSTTDRTRDASTSSSGGSSLKSRRSRSLNNVGGVSANVGLSAQKWQYHVEQRGSPVNWQNVQQRGESSENWPRKLEEYPQAQLQPAATFWGPTRETENSWKGSQESFPGFTSASWNTKQRHHAFPNVRPTQILEMGAMRSWVPPACYPAGAYGMIEQVAQRHHSLKKMLGRNCCSESAYSLSDDEDEDDLDE